MASQPEDLLAAIKARLELAKGRGLKIGEILTESASPNMSATTVSLSIAGTGVVNGLYDWVWAQVDIQIGGIRMSVNNPGIPALCMEIAAELKDWGEYEQTMFHFTSTGRPHIENAVRVQTGFITKIVLVLQFQQEEAIY